MLTADYLQKSFALFLVCVVLRRRLLFFFLMRVLIFPCTKVSMIRLCWLNLVLIHLHFALRIGQLLSTLLYSRG